MLINIPSILGTGLYLKIGELTKGSNKWGWTDNNARALQYRSRKTKRGYCTEKLVCVEK